MAAVEVLTLADPILGPEAGGEVTELVSEPGAGTDSTAAPWEDLA